MSPDEVETARSYLETTHDSLFGGQVTFVQPRRGYRVNVDSLLLADFASRGRCVPHALDLGSGVGAIALALHHLRSAAHFSLLDRNPELLRLAELNLAERGVQPASFVLDLESDSLPPSLDGTADLVTANPPFFEPSTSRVSPVPALGQARFGSVEPFLKAAASALRSGKSRAVFAYPARSLESFLETARRVQLVAKRLRFVHSRQSQPARLALVELRRARPGGLAVEPPLIEWGDGQERTPELVRIISGQAPDRR